MPWQSRFTKVLIGWFAVAAATAAAAVHYVSPGGSDGTGTGSSSSPWRTITYAVSQSSNGDTLELSAGTFTEAAIPLALNLTLHGQGMGSTIVQAATVWTNEQNGGVFSIASGIVTITGLTIRHGVATDGGGLFLQSGQVTLDRCEITRNRATFSGGGVCNGLWVDDDRRWTAVTLDRCVIADNDSDGRAGGVMKSRLRNCIVKNNRCAGHDDGMGHIEGGGGVFDSRTYQCTIVGNTSGNRGGGVQYGQAWNSIIAFNTAPLGPNRYDGGITACWEADPLFVNAAGWLDLRLQSASPCVNAGNNGSVATSVDYSGSPRIVGRVVDMGAFEYQAVVPIRAYEIWGGTTDYNAMSNTWDYYLSIDRYDYVKLAEGEGRLTASGGYPFYVLAARQNVEIDAVQGSDGLFYRANRYNSDNSERNSNLSNEPDANFCKLRGEEDTDGTYGSYFVVFNPGSWTGLTVLARPFGNDISTACRSLNDASVYLSVSPANVTTQYTATETLAAGLVATDINEGGQWLPAARQVAWGPFADANPRVLRYTAVASPPAYGTFSISGSVTLNGGGLPVDGPGQLVLRPPETVSTPAAPAGPTAGATETVLSYAASGALSSYGHGMQYRFDWNDGTVSDWGGATNSHSWFVARSYAVRAQARCYGHTSATSDWSAATGVTLSAATERVSQPAVLWLGSGLRCAENEGSTFVATNAENNLSHALQFSFDWGDGQPQTWGSATQAHAWAAAGAYLVSARARCASHPDILSAWSTTRRVIVLSAAQRAYPVESLALYNAAGCLSLAKSGGCLYVGSYVTDLRLFNVSSPSAGMSLSPVATVSMSPVVAERPVVVGNRLYVTGSSNGGIRIFDITDPFNPQPLGWWADPRVRGTSAHDVIVNGRYAYIAASGYGFRVADFLNPASPVTVGSVESIGSWWDHIAFDGRYIYGPNGRGAVAVIDVRTPGSPRQVTTLPETYGLALAGTVLYGGTSNDGLVIRDVASPAAPRELGRCLAVGDVSRTALVGSTAYVADGQGVSVVNVSDAAAPALIGHVPCRVGSVWDVLVDWPCLYVAGADGLEVLRYTGGGATRLAGLRVEGQLEMPERSAQTCRALALYDVGPGSDVSSSSNCQWRILESVPADWRFAGSVLAVGSVANDRTITVQAVYREGALSVTNRLPVLVRDVCEAPTPPAPWGASAVAPWASHLYGVPQRSSSHGHALEYFVNWGDGSTTDWGGDTQWWHSWPDEGSYRVAVQARCATETATTSAWSAARTVTVAQPARQLQAIELTQTLQNWRNQVALVAGKPFWIRVHVTSTMAHDSMPLYCRLTTPTMDSQFQLAAIPSAGSAFDRSAPSVAVQIPAFYAEAGPLTFSVSGPELTASPAFAGDPASLSVSASVVNTPPLPVRFVQIPWRDAEGAVHAPGEAERSLFHQAVAAGLPFPFLSEVSPPMTLEALPAAPLTTNDFSALVNAVDAIRLTDLAGGVADSNTVYVGLLAPPPPTGGGIRGAARRGGRALVAYALLDTFIHEMGHICALKHVASPGSNPPNTESYPYADGLFYPAWTDPLSADACTGWDSVRQSFYTTFGAARVYDCMAYAAARWPSDWNYGRMMNYARTVLQPPGDGGVPTALGIVPNDIQKCAQILGLVAPAAGTGTITQVTIAEGTPQPYGAAGAFELRLMNATNGVTARHLFDVEESSEGSATEGFGAVLAWPDDAETVRLYQGDTLLAQFAMPPAAFTLQVLSPNGGEVFDAAPIPVSWAQPPVSNLTFTVQYSPDNGGSWVTVADGIGGTSSVIPAGAVRGSTEALVRILTRSAGGSWGMWDASDAVFTVGNQPPTVRLLCPTNQIILGTQTATLQADGFDPEEGPLSDLQWASDINGSFGNGASLSPGSDVLAVGLHHITVTVQDSQGAAASATVTVTVVADNNADGIADDWQTRHYGSTMNADPAADTDNDGMTTEEEYEADTNPTQADSALEAREVSSGQTSTRLTWVGGVESWQYVESKARLDDAGWITLFTNQPPTSITNTWTDPTGSGNRTRYYRIRAVRP